MKAPFMDKVVGVKNEIYRGDKCRLESQAHQISFRYTKINIEE